MIVQLDTSVDHSQVLREPTYIQCICIHHRIILRGCQYCANSDIGNANKTRNATEPDEARFSSSDTTVCRHLLEFWTQGLLTWPAH